MKKNFLVIVFLMISLSFGFCKKYLDINGCIVLGVENNIDLKNLRYDIFIAGQDIDGVLSQYEPYSSASFSTINTSYPMAFYLSKMKQDILDITVSQKLRATGGTLALSFENKKETTEPLSLGYNPYYDTMLKASYSHPFLKNQHGKNDLLNIKIVDKLKDMTEYSYKMQRNLVAYNIKKGYWELVFANKVLELKRESLARAKKLLDNNRRKFNDGLLEETDVIASEVPVVLAEAGILKAEVALENTKENLYLLMNVSIRRDDYDFVLKYSDSFDGIRYNAAELAYIACKTRPDLILNNINIDIAKIDVDIKKDEQKPELSLNTSYGSTLRSWALENNYKNFFDFGNISWFLGLDFTFFPFNRKNLSAYGKSLANYKKAILAKELTKTNIVKDINTVTRLVNTEIKYLNAAEKARDLQAKKLALEEEKFARGRSSSQWVIMFQEDLANAEIEYYESLTNYHKLRADLILLTGEY